MKDIRIKTHEELTNVKTGHFIYWREMDSYNPKFISQDPDMRGQQIRTWGGKIVSWKEAKALSGQCLKIEGYIFGPNSWEYYTEPTPTKNHHCICDIKALFDQGCSCGGFQAEQAAMKKEEEPAMITDLPEGTTVKLNWVDLSA